MVRPLDGFPVDFGKRSAGRGPLDQVGIGDVRSSACHKAPIQSLSLFAPITTTSRSFVP